MGIQTHTSILRTANNNNNNVQTPRLNSVPNVPKLQDILVANVSLTVYFRTSSEISFPQLNITSTVTSFYRASTEENYMLNVTWEAIAKQINTFVTNSFKDKQDGFQEFANEHGSYMGFVTNHLPTDGLIKVQEGSFRGYFSNGVPQHYGHLSTNTLKISGNFNNGSPNGFAYITFPQNPTSFCRIYNSQNTSATVNPDSSDITSSIMKFFSDCQPIPNGSQNILNESGHFKGEIEDGKPVKGSIWVKGIEYSGGFLNCLPSGEGIMMSAFGLYTGAFNEGKKNGSGEIFQFDGLKYQGMYKDNFAHGQGELTLPNGNNYKGQFSESVFSGIGVYTYFDGNFHDGYWDKDKRHGEGRYCSKTEQS